MSRRLTLTSTTRWNSNGAEFDSSTARKRPCAQLRTRKPGGHIGAMTAGIVSTGLTSTGGALHRCRKIRSAFS
jgi:hypothetical protein